MEKHFAGPTSCLIYVNTSFTVLVFSFSRVSIFVVSLVWFIKRARIFELCSFSAILGAF